MIGNLQDTDGDGDVDEDDIPNVVFTSISGTLTVLEGDSGTTVWTKSGIDGYSTPAIADIDSDGIPDVITFNSAGRPMALDYQGNTIWTATTANSEYGPLAIVADVDGDGNPEVVGGNLLINGQTGALIATLSYSGSIPYTMSAVGDLDRDGQQEIIYANKVYDSSGSLLWAGSVAGSYGH